MKLAVLSKAIFKTSQERVQYACDVELDSHLTWHDANLQAHIKYYRNSLQKSIAPAICDNPSSAFQEGADIPGVDTLQNEQTCAGLGRPKESIQSAESLAPHARLVFEYSAAHYQIAHLRFGDAIPMTILHSFLKKFAHSTESFLLRELGIFSADDHIIKFLTEDTAVAAMRQNCVAYHLHLRQIRKLLAEQTNLHL